MSNLFTPFSGHRNVQISWRVSVSRGARVIPIPNATLRQIFKTSVKKMLRQHKNPEIKQQNRADFKSQKSEIARGVP
jgi:hypothetical protein